MTDAIAALKNYSELTFATEQSLNSLVAGTITDHSNAIAELKQAQEVVVVALHSRLPHIGKAGVVYVVEHDETARGQTVQYIWNGVRYLSVNTPLSQKPGNTLQLNEDGLYLPTTMMTWTRKVW